MKIEGLSTELSEKVQACDDPRQLLDLAKSEGVELPDSALEDVAGGIWDSNWGKTPICPDCGAELVYFIDEGTYTCYICDKNFPSNEVIWQ